MPDVRGCGHGCGCHGCGGCHHDAEAAVAAVALVSGLVAAAAAAVVTEAIGAGALVGWSGATDSPPALVSG